jgi:hypothetical protein
VKNVEIKQKIQMTRKTKKIERIDGWYTDKNGARINVYRSIKKIKKKKKV